MIPATKRKKFICIDFSCIPLACRDRTAAFYCTWIVVLPKDTSLRGLTSTLIVITTLSTVDEGIVNYFKNRLEVWRILMSNSRLRVDKYNTKNNSQ